MSDPNRPTYYEVLAQAHRRLRPTGYLEIGVHEGHSLQLADSSTRCVGVDPEPNIGFDTTATIVATTSDAYFAERDLSSDLGTTLDLAFIDGLHLFEQALRDFINVEANASPNTVVMIHDCLPIDSVTSARERTTVIWSGDVWKVVVALARHRGDLTITTLDAQPTGLGVIRGLDPTSHVLSDRFDDIVAELAETDYDEEFRSELSVTDVTPATLSAVFGPLPAGA
ncbi:MAG: class I SAM-dependent methyltransferase [Acidobacteria bacterium]|nr:class I SAM-dependent methyltransferase [Acidobacteriota bacterium]